MLAPASCPWGDPSSYSASGTESEPDAGARAERVATHTATGAKTTNTHAVPRTDEDA
jgi:hypothetical protein